MAVFTVLILIVPFVIKTFVFQKRVWERKFEKMSGEIVCKEKIWRIRYNLKPREYTIDKVSEARKRERSLSAGRLKGIISFLSLNRKNEIN